ncbi:DNA mismatch repair protein Msh6 [Porphyridium purpureum]|uniref:DNA mismatch repair protein n=1 Tax=Porphyridium purpureum TaxID=35688 RepID=A0A5J4YW88_PORPP|nr:DNA mismatch repair protein Msh6 [Porphyridium purpureum]|eukprot:POR3510..scf227_4
MHRAERPGRQQKCIACRALFAMGKSRQVAPKPGEMGMGGLRQGTLHSFFSKPKGVEGVTGNSTPQKVSSVLTPARNPLTFGHGRSQGLTTTPISPQDSGSLHDSSSRTAIQNSSEPSRGSAIYHSQQQKPRVQASRTIVFSDADFGADEMECDEVFAEVDRLEAVAVTRKKTASPATQVTGKRPEERRHETAGVHLSRAVTGESQLSNRQQRRAASIKIPLFEQSSDEEEDADKSEDDDTEAYDPHVDQPDFAENEDLKDDSSDEEIQVKRPRRAVVSAVPKPSIARDLDDGTDEEQSDEEMRSRPGLGNSAALAESAFADPFSVEPEFLPAEERKKKCALLAPGGKFGNGDDAALGAEALGGEAKWSHDHSWAKDVRDAQGRRPSEPSYDPTTLSIPKKDYEKLTPYQKQFWDVKSKHYNVVIFFKKGKFYEMYDVDADLCHSLLGLNYTGGGRVDMRCVGVPETAFDRHAAELLKHGYAVGRVEQTESALESSKKSGSKNVCERSLVKILTRGSVLEASMLSDHETRYILAIAEEETAVTEQEADGPHGMVPSHVTIEGSLSLQPVLHDRVTGVCYVDVATGRILVGGWPEDKRRSQLERLLALLSPLEIVVASDNQLEPDTSNVRSPLVHGLMRRSKLSLGARGGGFEIIQASAPFLGMKKLASRVSACVAEQARPRVSAAFASMAGTCAQAGVSSAAAKALSMMFSYLSELKIAEGVFSGGNIFALLEPSLSNSACSVSRADIGPLCAQESLTASYDAQDEAAAGTSAGDKEAATALEECIKQIYAPRVTLDAECLAHLEVLSNGEDGSEVGSLIQYLDRGVYSAGRRMLRQWVAQPLADVRGVADRLNAVDMILCRDADSSGVWFRNTRARFKQLPDLERGLAKLQAAAVTVDRAVMFDNSQERKVRDFVRTLEGLDRALALIRDMRDDLFGDGPPSTAPRPDAAVTHPSNNLTPNPGADAGRRSLRLEWLLWPGFAIPATAQQSLEEYLHGNAFDWALATQANPELIPRTGVDVELDAATDRLKKVEAHLDQILNTLKKQWGEPLLKWYHRGKEPYQLEVPGRWLARHQHSNKLNGFQLMSQGSKKSGDTRYWTADIRALVRDWQEASETLAAVQKQTYRRIITKFMERGELWKSVASCIAEMDALLALAVVSLDQNMCRPTMVNPNSGKSLGQLEPQGPFLRAEGLYHCVLALRMQHGFVTNNVALGVCDEKVGGCGTGHQARVMILSGPNMGGKSTLLRQIALAVIMAQVGCYVPASSFALTPVDRIFTRLGAVDRITRGQSTFMVEMEETAAMLKYASPHSLLILDELGRGTSTFDGVSIAGAVLEDVIQRLQCRALFSTHYHGLCETLPSEMAKHVSQYQMAAEVDEAEQRITFLYKLIKGSAPYSRGIYCAKIAGIPNVVTEAAEQHALRLEADMERKKMTGAIASLLERAFT